VPCVHVCCSMSWKKTSSRGARILAHQRSEFRPSGQEKRRHPQAGARSIAICGARRRRIQFCRTPLRVPVGNRAHLHAGPRGCNCSRWRPKRLHTSRNWSDVFRTRSDSTSACPRGPPGVRWRDSRMRGSGTGATRGSCGLHGTGFADHPVRADRETRSPTQQHHARLRARPGSRLCLILPTASACARDRRPAL
jgi:hypothetical protein